MHDQRVAELRRRIDEVSAEFVDVLGSEQQDAPLCIGAVLITAWGDPTDPDDETYIRTTASTTTPDMVRIGMVTFAAARAVGIE